MAYVDHEGVEWLTMTEVAEFLKVKLNTVSSYRSRKQPISNPFPQPGDKVGLQLMWRREDVTAWQSRRQGRGTRVT